MSIKAIIIDDEQESINALKIKLDACGTAVEIIDTFNSAEGMAEKLVSYKFDVLFLDVDMPKVTGIDLMKQLKERDFHIVLVTAYDSYALNAIKENALDYLMKPVDMDDLEDALEKIKKEKKKSTDNDLVQQLSSIIGKTTPSVPKLALSSLNETYYVHPEDIIYILGENNYSTFYMKNGQKIVVSKTLKEYESILPEHEFFRAHKSSLINLNCIKKLNKVNDLSVTMLNDETISISFRRKADFLRIMKENTL